MDEQIDALVYELYGLTEEAKHLILLVSSFIFFSSI